jgi:Excalibur calcium-binding domain
MTVSRSMIAIAFVTVAMPFLALSAKVGAQTASTLDNRFFNCTAAKNAGVSNVPVPPGYRPQGWKHTADGDSDGIACESNGR